MFGEFIKVNFIIVPIILFKNPIYIFLQINLFYFKGIEERKNIITFFPLEFGFCGTAVSPFLPSLFYLRY